MSVRIPISQVAEAQCGTHDPLVFISASSATSICHSIVASQNTPLPWFCIELASGYISRRKKLVLPTSGIS